MTPVLQLDRLCWSVGGADIIDGVSLAVREGELLAVIGPNGAGKTSLFNLITGLTRPTLYRKIAEGTFPRQIRISTNGIGWRESAVDAWLRSPMTYRASEDEDVPKS